MRSAVVGSSVLLLVLVVASRADAQARTNEDPLELRLDASGLSEAQLAATTEPVGPSVDLELRLVSEPAGRGLRATRMLEDGPGVERRQCRAPCTTYLERGSYRFSVENRRGRGREAPGIISLNFDGTLFLSMHSRRPARAAWWTATAALVGSGLALYMTHRDRQFRDDPLCSANCTYYTSGQRVAMTVGGVMVMFGGIAMRYAIATRDSGVVRYEVSPRSRHVDPDEAR